MHWIIQENLFNESEWATLVSTLERFNIPFSIHKVVPFTGDLIPEAIPLTDKVICFGSYSMRHSAKANKWRPGVYDLEECNFLKQREIWGTEMLNYDSEVLPFKDVILTEDTFIRPIEDSKVFAGKVFDADEFNAWKNQVIELNEDYGTSLSSLTLVQVCIPKTIYAEYRFWIVDGNIVTKSLYKRGNKCIQSPDVDDRFDEYVKDMIEIWKPHNAFVIDVCDTDEGIKIVEINTINAAGFYAGNMQKLILALEEMEN